MPFGASTDYRRRQAAGRRYAARNSETKKSERKAKAINDFLNSSKNHPAELVTVLQTGLQTINAGSSAVRYKDDCIGIADEAATIAVLVVDIYGLLGDDTTPSPKMKEDIKQLAQVFDYAHRTVAQFGTWVSKSTTYEGQINNSLVSLHKIRPTIQKHYDNLGINQLEDKATRFAYGENNATHANTTGLTASTEITVPDTFSRVLELTKDVSREHAYPVARGGFADIWKCSWRAKSGIHEVAIKVMRPVAESEETQEKKIKRFHREVKVWHRLDHENVLPLYGLCAGFGPYYGMVCPWVDGGDLNKFLESGNATRPGRVRILRDMAAGLSYLHGNSVIHGDLTPANILIGRQGRAYLMDFGLSTIIAEFKGTSYFTSTIGGSIRWAAAELYRVQEGYIPTLEPACDIYSFGCVMLQVISGRIPYEDLSTIEVLHELNRGHHPPRPAGLPISGEEWNFMSACWDDQKGRPTIDEVATYVNKLA